MTTPPASKAGTHYGSADIPSYSPTCCYNSFTISPPFDSAMALTLLVFLAALFFLGFFSVYIRRFADHDTVDPTRRRRRRSAAAAARLGHGKRSDKMGVDSRVVESLPMYAYNGVTDVEQGQVGERDCAVCLSEFEESELVKEIPYCGHVFHVECIVTWLSSHVTCPLCRTAEFFPASQNRHPRVEEKGVMVESVRVNEYGTVREKVRENIGACRHVTEGGNDSGQDDTGPENVRRTAGSCRWNGERVRLHRSLSF